MLMYLIKSSGGRGPVKLQQPFLGKGANSNDFCRQMGRVPRLLW